MATPPLLVTDARQTAQPISCAVDTASPPNLVPVHAPAVTIGGVATPVSPTNPLPVINAAGAAASDGSGTITLGGTAQVLFASTVPVNGYLIQNNSSGALWVSDVGGASAGGSSIQILANGGIFVTPTGYRPPGAVSIFGASTSQAFAARRW